MCCTQQVCIFWVLWQLFYHYFVQALTAISKVVQCCVCLLSPQWRAAATWYLE
jgi:hypothetical protein